MGRPPRALGRHLRTGANACNEARRDLPHGLFRVRFAFWVLSIWSVLYRCDVKQSQRHQLTRLDTQSLGFLQP